MLMNLKNMGAALGTWRYRFGNIFTVGGNFSENSDVKFRHKGNNGVPFW